MQSREQTSSEQLTSKSMKSGKVVRFWVARCITSIHTQRESHEQKKGSGWKVEVNDLISSYLHTHRLNKKSGKKYSVFNSDLLIIMHVFDPKIVKNDTCMKKNVKIK